MYSYLAVMICKLARAKPPIRDKGIRIDGVYADTHNVERCVKKFFHTCQVKYFFTNYAEQKRNETNANQNILYLVRLD